MEDTLIMDAVINKYFAGETSDREEQFLMAWLEESEEHRKYFFELKSIWNARNVFAESADLGRFAAFMRSTDARIAKIAGEERARRRRGLLRWSMSAAAAVLLVVCAGFAWHFLAGPDIYRVYENNTETVTTVTLDDGTQVWLNARTRLILPKAFSPTERNVKLAGAAFFEVARDEAAPFTVATDDNHNWFPLTDPMCDSFGGFIQIKAPELTYEAVIKAMKEGNFYFSMAPEIHEAKIEDGVLKVKTSPVEKIFVVTDSRDCYKKLAPKGETITEAEFPLNGKDAWVRIQIRDGKGKFAGTNAVYLK